MDYLNYGKSDTTKPTAILRDYIKPLYYTPIWNIPKPLPPRAHEWALSYRKQLYDQGRNVSNRGGWQSPSKPWEEFEYKDHVQSTLNQFQEFKEFEVTNWWLNINEKGHYNIKHVHANSDLSGIWYITNNEGLLVFEDPLIFSRNQLHGTIFNSTPLQTLTCPAGDLVIFPSDLPHHVEEHKLDIPRISVSFNMSYCY